MNEVKPIRGEADHEAALAEVERLWGAHSGTPEGDRLDVLATLIDAYESDHHPIEAIKFRMEQQGLRAVCLERERCCLYPGKIQSFRNRTCGN